MNYKYTLPAALIGVSIALVQTQTAFAISKIHSVPWKLFFPRLRFIMAQILPLGAVDNDLSRLVGAENCVF
ncbi:hypothetical protein [Sphaerospermopsis torques-reginae]|uniref:Uncharacterized protein n=1 Tax=Sphaerospermopsis torques-reginae ITEP-024 TaxID=984208 RepID=A0ABX8X278_9CYAN|nr:hypothetical protein [Sphaerospermopsis torques-reginae]QYX32628.1 hypothetical protein K2F26_04395 [Sphaerospermopsis torques-reginae ITEP-024]